jgi:hypothetical protein
MSIFNVSGIVASNSSSEFPWLKPNMWYSVRILMGPDFSTIYFDHDDAAFLRTSSLASLSNVTVWGPVFIDEVVLKQNQSLQKCYPSPASFVATTNFPQCISLPNSHFCPLNQQLSNAFQFDTLPWSLVDILGVIPSSTGSFAATITLSGSGFSLSPFSACVFDFGLH